MEDKMKIVLVGAGSVQFGYGALGDIFNSKHVYHNIGLQNQRGGYEIARYLLRPDTDKRLLHTSAKRQT